MDNLKDEYTEVLNTGNKDRCEKCAFVDKLEYCETGEVVPRGCHKRNTYWTTMESKVEAHEDEIEKITKSISDARRNHKTLVDKLLNRIWKLRGKVAILKGDMK